MINSDIVRYCQILSDIVKYNSKGFSRVYHGCFEDVKCFRGNFIAGFKVVTRLIQEDSLYVPRISVWCSMGASWVRKRCVKSV